MKNEIVTSVEQKEKRVIYVQKEASRQKDNKVLVKYLATGEIVHKQICFEEELQQFEDQGQVL